ncbi:spore germination protein [Fictibacillus phosphorivorans]|uniref:spore germination protein n=1 Tax=Fictibacillus phosphorivorans TaxID=1221500 RepID=UPI003CD0D299
MSSLISKGININRIAPNSVASFGDAFTISPHHSFKANGGSGSLNTGNNKIICNGPSYTVTIDNDKNDSNNSTNL